MADDLAAGTGSDDFAQRQVRADALGSSEGGRAGHAAGAADAGRRAELAAGSSGRVHGPDRATDETELSRADRVIEFIEKLKIPFGKHRGKRLILREWQRDIIRAIYDPVWFGTQRRKIRRALISMARKNGKTALIAALVLVHLVGPEATFGQEIYSAANDKEQAAIVYRHAAGYVEMSDELSELVKPIPSRKRLICKMFGSFYAALSSDAKTKHGLNPAVWIYDELGQTTKADLYEALDTSQGAQDEPLGIVISTQAVDPNSLMSQLVEDGRQLNAGVVEDETRVAIIYEVPQDADPWLEENWKLANPAIGDFLSIEDMRAEAAQAKRLPSRAASFRNLRLNQQVSGLANIIGREDWEACGGVIDRASLRGKKCYGALDLSKRFDLTAFELVFPLEDDTRAVLSNIWTPEWALAERAQKDKAHYPVWVEQGHLIAVPGRSIDYRYVAKAIAEAQAEFDLQAIAYDRWRIEDLKNALDDEGIAHFVDGRDEDNGGIKLVPFGQGFKDMGPAVDALEEIAVQHLLRHGDNPVLTWAISNAVATLDPAGARKLDKSKARSRIDPAVALVMANSLASRATERAAPGSIWDDIAKQDAEEAAKAANG